MTEQDRTAEEVTIDPALADEIEALRINVQEAEEALTAGLGRQHELTKEHRTADAAIKALQDTIDRGDADSIEATEQLAKDWAAQQERIGSLAIFKEKTIPALKNRHEGAKLLLMLHELTAGLSGIISDGQARVMAAEFAQDTTERAKELLIKFLASDAKKREMFQSVQSAAKSQGLNAMSLERTMPGLMVDTLHNDRTRQGFTVEGFTYDGHEYKGFLDHTLNFFIERIFDNAMSDARAHLRREAAQQSDADHDEGQDS